MSHDLENVFGKVIYGYTRTQALEDGVLIDVSEMAREAGFKIPVAVTRSVSEQYIEWTEKDSINQTAQDEAGRLWDVLSMLMLAIRGRGETDQLIYQLLIILRDGKSSKPKLVKLKSCIHGGDKKEPVITRPTML